MSGTDLPKPPPRCGYCDAYDGWEEGPKVIDLQKIFLGTGGRVEWTCGICNRVTVVPIPPDDSKEVNA